MALIQGVREGLIDVEILPAVIAAVRGIDGIPLQMTPAFLQGIRCVRQEEPSFPSAGLVELKIPRRVGIWRDFADGLHGAAPPCRRPCSIAILTINDNKGFHLVESPVADTRRWISQKVQVTEVGTISKCRCSDRLDICTKANRRQLGALGERIGTYRLKRIGQIDPHKGRTVAKRTGQARQRIGKANRFQLRAI